MNRYEVKNRRMAMWLVGLFGVFFLIGIWLGVSLFLPMSARREVPVLVMVPPGMTVSQLTRQLDTSGLIRSASVFKVLARLRSLSLRLKAGAYAVSPTWSTWRVLHYFETHSGTDGMLRVTVPEGLRLIDIAAILEKERVVSANVFYTYVRHSAKSELTPLYPFLDSVPTANLEGYLYPETYYFARGVNARIVTRAMLDQFERTIVAAFDSAPTVPGSPKARFNFHELVSLASIVQKEAVVVSEMPMIASVFNNRLKKRMPLAADPTVVYALGQRHKPIVYYKDLKIDSPYNTYKYAGFPPTPIAAPSLAAFKAVLSPTPSPYYFFVANRDGTHIFTRTYQEHLRVQRNL